MQFGKFDAAGTRADPLPALPSRSAEGYGGGGAAMYESSFTMDGSNVTDSSTGLDGGGLCAWRGSSLTVSRATVRNCTSLLLTGGGISGLFTPNITISNSAIVGNTAAHGGGGLALWHGTATVTDSQIAGNLAELGGGGGALVQGASARRPSAPLAPRLCLARGVRA